MSDYKSCTCRNNNAERIIITLCNYNNGKQIPKGHFSDTQKIPEEVNLLFSGEYLMQGKLLVYVSVERTELIISTMSQYKCKVYFIALLWWGSPDGPDIRRFVSLCFFDCEDWSLSDETLCQTKTHYCLLGTCCKQRGRLSPTYLASAFGAGLL